MEPKIVTVAREMFNAYNERGGWKTFDGRDVPKWEALGDEVRARWVAAAGAARPDLVDISTAPANALVGDEPLRRLAGGRAIMAEGKDDDIVLWFDDRGMGPNPTEWTIESHEPPGPGGISHVGIRFHGEGGPLMSPATANTFGYAVIAAARHARRAELAAKEPAARAPTPEREDDAEKGRA